MEVEKQIARVIDTLAGKEFVVFAGGGVAKPTGIPLWKGLLKVLIDEQPVKGVRLDEVSESHYPAVAQMVYDEFQSHDRAGDYDQIIRDKVCPSDISHTPLQCLIPEVSGRIVTTNFDGTFDKAFQVVHRAEGQSGGCRYQTIRSLRNEDIKRRDFVTYLHGRFDENQIVFRTEEYAKHYTAVLGGSRSPVETLIKFIYENETLVFIGFSFGDRYVTKAFEAAWQDLKGEDADRAWDPSHMELSRKVNHYAFLEDIKSIDFDKYEDAPAHSADVAEEKRLRMEAARADALALDTKLNSMGIEVIRYDRHVLVEGWLERLRDMKDARRSAMKT